MPFRRLLASFITALPRVDDTIVFDGFVAWFGKLVPHAVEDFHATSAADMARFGTGGVTVAAATAQANPAVRQLVVDWAGLEAMRPAVQLEDRAPNP